MDLTAENFKDWTPGRVFQNENGALMVDWIFPGKERFTQPFHNDTLEICLRQPFNQLFSRQTPVEFLGEIYERSKGIKPTGFIFHISRCGSTLVSQMLAALEKNIVISEAAVIDKIIRTGNVSDEEKVERLRWLFNAMAQKRFSAEENFFVKFDCWNVFDLPLIERAFPDVPWIFMYRNPIEVLVSQVRQPGVHMIPAAIEGIFPGMNLFEILQFSLEERFARSIAAFCEAGIKNADRPNWKFINYAQLPEAVTSEIFEHFNVNFSDEEIEKMKGAAKFNAKTPQQEFSPDSEEKRKEASENLVYFAEKYLTPLYEQLEEIRLKKSPSQ